MKKQKNSKKRKLNKISRLTIYLFATAIVAGVFLIMYFRVVNATDTYILESGTLYLEEVSVGYVIRDEVVVKGENYKNGIIKILSEGERAAKNQQIFRYYSSTEEETTKKIEEINLKLQEALSSETAIPSTADIKLIDEQINEKTSKLSTLNDIQEIEEYKKEINSLIEKKAQIIGENSKSGSYIKSLMDEKEKYEKELSSNSEYVKAPMSGIVSYRTDGLESILTPNCFDALSVDYLNDLDLKTGKIVSTSNEEGKVVNNFLCYIATISKSDEAKNAEVGDKVKLKFLGDSEVTAQISFINKSDENNIIIVFEINKLVDKLIDYRKIDFDIIWWSDTGLKVPNQSILTDENGLKYVVRNRSGYLDKMLVKVLSSNSTHSIIEAYTTDELEEIGYEDISNYKKISLYDEIVLDPTWESLE